MNEVSVTGAELIAIKVALEVVNDESLEQYVIFTDSKSACEILDNAKQQSKREEIINDILVLASRWKVSIQWIPSHVGDKGNDLADDLAKQGAEGKHCETLDNSISYSDVYLILKKRKQFQANDWYKEYGKEKGKKPS
ncbi:uncharacterized protein LOC129729110 [Wyeomyia smithii]|uniref:uncharacterized protein LOC129729110 n=1 Tax=Wyeomyia smithii TaxID=174621 RepID=UPI002467E2B3|nr:uncharacterized protein LOC129729110 [Wyeomyia smithii]